MPDLAGPPLKLATDDGHDPPQAALPIRKQIDILNLAPDSSRHRAAVQTDGDEKNVIQRNAPRAIQSITDFGLKPAFLGYRMPREARYDKIGGLNGVFDGSRPVLAGQQLAPVDPGIETLGFERVA